MKVSVIVPAYNVARYLERSVASILKTDYSPLEVVIVEDGSEDATLAVAMQIKARYPTQVTLITHRKGKNLGAGESRNTGIRAANGELIAFLDADDEYLSNRFDKCIDILTNEREVDGVYENTRIALEDGGDPVTAWSKDGIVDVRKPDNIDMFDFVLKGLGCWTTNAITLRKDVFQSVGYFNPKLKLAQDLELWFRLLLVKNLVEGNSQEPVAIYRRHSTNRSFPEQYNHCIIPTVAYAILFARRKGVSSDKMKSLEEFFESRTKARLGWLITHKQLEEARLVLYWIARVYPFRIMQRFYIGNLRNFIVARLYGKFAMR